MKRGMGDNAGFALILTLIITALLVALVVEMAHQVYVDVSLSRSFRDGQQAAILAESGVEGGKFILANASQNKTLFQTILVNGFKQENEIGSLAIFLKDESGKLNINDIVNEDGTENLINMKSVQTLGTLCNIPKEDWYTVAYWINNKYEKNIGSAAMAYFRSKGYNSRNNKLETVKELTLIHKDFKPEIVSKLEPFFTVVSNRGSKMTNQININSAPPEVLASLDIKSDVVTRIIANRPYEGSGELLERVPEMKTISPTQSSRISYTSRFYEVTAVATVKDTTKTIKTVLDAGSPKTWIEY